LQRELELVRAEAAERVRAVEGVAAVAEQRAASEANMHKRCAAQLKEVSKPV